MNDIIETLSQEIAKSAGSPEEARDIVADLVKVDWQSYFLGGKIQVYSSAGLAARVAILEQEVAELKKQLSKEKPRPYKKTPRMLPALVGQPEGTMTAYDFYAAHDVSSGRLRYHTEQGIYGDFLETTDVPHPTRPGYKDRLLTPEQQKKAIEYWKKHGIVFKMPED
jgi:uncharacterized small protein (DUF1192 family)